MDSKSYNKGFPLSSTPIQSLEDSGYFGSGQRRNLCSKVFSTCSPIKEFTFKHPKNACFIVSKKSQIKNVHDYENITKSELLSNAEASELAGPDFSPEELHTFKLGDFPIASDIYLQNSSHDFSPDKENSFSFYSSPHSNDIRYNLFPGCHSDDLAVSNLDYPKYSKNSSMSMYQEENCEKNSSPQKYSFKQTKIDFICEFRNKNCTSILSTIFSCLSPEELCRASCVSKDWNTTILNDKQSRSRKEKFIEQRTIFLTGPSKENRLGMRCGPAREHKNTFSNLTNTVNTTMDLLSTKKSKSRFDSFIIERKDEHTKLFKCPKCCYASKLQSENNCICTRCSYRFCPECLSPIFKNHTCYKPELPKTYIGGKQSKKNLRRL